MIYEVLVLGLTLFLLYSIYLIFWDKGPPRQGGPIEDFIIAADHDDDDETITSNHNSDTKSKYNSIYEENGRQVLILYGTEYGFSEEVARKLYDALNTEDCLEYSIQPRLVNAKDYKVIDFEQERVVLNVFSTTGDGDPPSDAKEFMNFISTTNGTGPSLKHIQYSVLALGDSNYPHYCETGRTLDETYKRLYAMELYPRVDVDQEDWEQIDQWIDYVVKGVLSINLPIQMDYLDLSQLTEESGFSRTKPFFATITDKHLLTAKDVEDDKETVHVEVDITGSDMEFTAGDALGIVPCNNPPEVDQLLLALHSTGNEHVPIPPVYYEPKPIGTTLPLKEALLHYYDLKVVKLDLIKLLLLSVTDTSEKQLAQQLLKHGVSKSNSVLADYLSNREVVDVLKSFSSFKCPVEEILKLLKPLQPRYYSIASSPVKNDKSVSICVAVVRYSLYNTPRTGVCTTFLQDRVTLGDTVPVFMSCNPHFRLPLNGDIPIIMIGPGTGLAPFRAFLQERVLNKAKGRNVLYFGCRNKNKDFLYRNELESWVIEGVVLLRTAFSRDQKKKIYVQHLIKEDAHLLWELIDKENAHIYVCGDAKNMAVDVHQTLRSIIVNEGGMNMEIADQYINKLEKAERYQKDVWVT